MAELSQEEKDKLWADLKVQWQIVKGKGEGAEKAKKRINMIQKMLDLEITDFDKEEPTKEVKEYTVAEAEAFFTEEELNILDMAQDMAIASRTYIADSTPKKCHALKGNQAGIGQIVNISINASTDYMKAWLKRRVELK